MKRREFLTRLGGTMASVRAIACVVLIMMCASAVAAEPDRSGKPTSAEAYMRVNPIIFVVAHGDADACGQGCSEWIAAEGMFDPDAEKRFRNFLGTLKGRKLPIYFNSIGGVMGQSRLLGRILREREMTASVGATIPKGCRVSNPMDASCRQIMQSNKEVTAQLLSVGAMCHSACIYALIGASVRHVPAGALLGIHAAAPTSASIAILRRPGAPTEQQFEASRKRYVREMGADPELVDLAAKTPAESLHILSRDEIVRFRIETRGVAGAQ